MSGISTHVLDTSTGRPAAALHVTLHRWSADTWLPVASSLTDSDGRCRQLLASPALMPPAATASPSPPPNTSPAPLPPPSTLKSPSPLLLDPGASSCHIPLLLGPFGYTTYRGT